MKLRQLKFAAALIAAVCGFSTQAQSNNGLNFTTYLPAGSGPWVSPDRNTLTPLSSGTIASIYNDWDFVLTSGRNNGVVVKFTGFFRAGDAGTYNFGLEGDDGVELIMKGQTVISHWADQPGTFRSGTIALTAGEIVPITIWYYENGGGARLRFTQQVNGSYVVVPTSALSTTSLTWAPSTCNPCTPNTNNPNVGFESGTTANWSISNGTGTARSATGWSSNGSGVNTTTGITNYSPGGGRTWNVTPYGQYMMSIQPGGGSPNFDPAMTALGLNSTEISQIRSYLTSLGGNSTPTNASWARRTVYLQAGITYRIAWQYMSTDYVPFNDGSTMTLVHSTDASRVPTLNNEVKRYALLGFTNPGTGNYSTDSYGSTGWQLATITVPVDGDYILGFASFNLGDTALSPILLVDDLQGTTTLNGQTFAPVQPNAGSSAPATAPAAPALCCGGSAAPFNPNAAFVARRQGFAATGDNRVVIEQIGNSNSINVSQTGARNSVEYRLSGSNNSATITQNTGNTTSTNFIEATITGSSNSTAITQTSTGGASVLLTVNNNNNNVTVQQLNSGQHHAEIALTGGNKTVNLTQQGSAGHMARIELHGGATSLTATQTGSTAQSYSITHTCAVASCAAITVTQGQ